MTNNGVVNIHGKEYMTVAGRLDLAHKAGQLKSIVTEVLPNDSQVVIKATVTLKNGQVFTGISAANPLKAIEKQSPYEVAETSAVGRALGFAGFGVIDGIASADEIFKAEGKSKVKNLVEGDKCALCSAVHPYHKPGCPNGKNNVFETQTI